MTISNLANIDIPGRCDRFIDFTEAPSLEPVLASLAVAAG